VGPSDILSKIELSGTVPRSTLEDGGIGEFVAECGATLGHAYAMAHVFTDRQANEYHTAWRSIPDEDPRTVGQGSLPYYLPDLYWGNVFGPSYVELFGADRLRTAPAAVVTEFPGGGFYVQVTDSILDLSSAEGIPRYRAARDAVKEYLGSDCFYGAAALRRAPHWRIAAVDGLWHRPRESPSLMRSWRWCESWAASEPRLPPHHQDPAGRLGIRPYPVRGCREQGRHRGRLR
jgi:hypothetical protein